MSIEHFVGTVARKKLRTSKRKSVAHSVEMGEHFHTSHPFLHPGL